MIALRLAILTPLALGSALHAAGVMAQSSVTLYGVIDAGITYNTNVGGKSQWAETTGVVQQNRWGLKGNEDLGGGNSAVFLLENGFDLGTGALGQGSRMFGRQAFVGVSNREYGTVTLGRQYDSAVDYVAQFYGGALWGTPQGHPADIDNVGNTFRSNNAIKYASRSYNGLKFGGLYGFGGTAGSFSRNQIWSVGGSFVRGPLGLAASYLNVKNPNTSFASSIYASSVASGNYYAAPVDSGYASARSFSSFATAAHYILGPVAVGLEYSHVRFANLGDTTSGPNPYGYSGNAVFNIGDVSAKYAISPALSVSAVYSYTVGGAVSGKKSAAYQQLTLGTDYFLSKRTDVYLVGIYQRAGGVDSTNTAAHADICGLSPSSTGSQAYLRAGIRHRF